MSDQEIYRKITQYINGELSEDEIEKLWEKFVDNPEYYSWFETELHLRDLAKESADKNITSISPQNKNGKKNDRNASKTWLFAVAAIILLGIGYQLYSLQDTVNVHPHSIAKIEIDEMSGTDILRSDEATASIIDVEISRALTMAYEGDVEASSDKLKMILTENPEPEQESRILMNLGILHYNMGDFEGAKSYFDRAGKNEEMNRFFREKAWWFLGNAYLNLEMLEEAREAIYTVYSADGRFAAEAEILLQKLDN